MDNASFCLKCKTRKDCKKTCKKLEKYLCKLQSKDGYSDRHLRRKELLWDSMDIEDLAGVRAMELKYGKKWAHTQIRKEKNLTDTGENVLK